MKESPGSSAWEILSATGQLSQIDIEQAQLLSKLYRQQSHILDFINEIYNFIIDREFLNEPQAKNNLLLLSMHLEELHAREVALLMFYNEALAFLKPEPKTLSNHYQINVKVDPAKGFVKSHCSLHFVADKETKEITYWMNDAFQPIAVEGADIDSVWVTDGPEGLPAQMKEVHIRFKNTLQKGEATKIDFDYQGTLSADQFIDPGDITPAWTDLSVGALWYPLSMEEAMLTYEITLTAPKQYTVESAGEIIPLGDTRWLIREDTETPGRIILVLSDQLHKVRTRYGNYTIDFFVIDQADPFLDTLQNFAKTALQFFEEKLDPVEGGNKHLKICFPNLDLESASEGAYSSNGSFVMLTNQRDAYQQFATLSHEIAHFWWRHGDLGNYHDFLNEGLAEFSTLMLINETYGEEKIASTIRRYRKNTKELGSIKAWNMENSGQRNHYLYWKGSLVMLDLLDETGEEKLYTILQKTAAEKVNHYEDFLEIIREVAGRDVAVEFDREF